MERILADILQYIQGNPAGAIAAGVILLFFLIKKPKLFFVLLLLCIAGGGVMLILDNLSSTGILERDFRSLNEMK